MATKHQRTPITKSDYDQITTLFKVGGDNSIQTMANKLNLPYYRVQRVVDKFVGAMEAKFDVKQINKRNNGRTTKS